MSFGVEPVPEGLELGSELDVVVDLAVEHDRVATVGAPHRLPSCLGQVENREPPAEEHDLGREDIPRLAPGVELAPLEGEPARVVGASVTQELEDACGSSGRRRRRRPEQEPRDPAHVATSSAKAAGERRLRVAD